MIEKTQSTESASQEVEVVYGEETTPLFLAIENADWRQALDLVESNPEQARTWVSSSGGEKSSINFSMWRRLPIHEACRRQAPAWLVSSLFSAFPESAFLTTQFGELPLHLAVESGATPEVVNLIVVANWEAIVTPDNSGRIPTEILDRSELLQLDDHRIVHESLSRCHKAYIDMKNTIQIEQDAMERKYKDQMEAAQREHEEVLSKERQKQEEIQKEVKDLEERIIEIEDFEFEKDQMMSETATENMGWREKVESLTAKIEGLQKEIAQEKNKASSMREELTKKDAQIKKRDEQIKLLSDDLRNVSLMHDEDLMDSIIEAERTMRAMVSSQIYLQKQFVGQSNGLKALLSARGIQQEESPVSSHQEEKEPQDEEDLMDPSAAANALAAAAMAALQKTPLPSV